MSLLWYYRPEHTKQGRLKEDMPDELFASKHRDVNSVACIDDRCYVLTFNEYCRSVSCLRRIIYYYNSYYSDDVNGRNRLLKPFPGPDDSRLVASICAYKLTCRRVKGPLQVTLVFSVSQVRNMANFTPCKTSLSPFIV